LGLTLLSISKMSRESEEYYLGLLRYFFRRRRRGGNPDDPDNEDDDNPGDEGSSSPDALPGEPDGILSVAAGKQAIMAVSGEPGRHRPSAGGHGANQVAEREGGASGGAAAQCWSERRLKAFQEFREKSAFFS
jgi:hypothetical protein